MYLLYVDESGDPGQYGSSHLVLGAVALFEGKWRYLDADLRNLIDRYFPTSPKPSEIHLAPLRSGKQEYRALDAATRQKLLDEFCGIVTSLLSTEITLFTVVADKSWWFGQNPGKTGDDLYAELFENLSSRFDLYLRRRYSEGAPSKGIIIADPHKVALSASLRTNHRLFQRSGNRWNPQYNLIETVFFLDSHESPGLQLADLCSYSIWRMVTAKDTALATVLANTFDREPLTSRVNPGKCHGVKYLGADPAIRSLISHVWS